MSSRGRLWQLSTQRGDPDRWTAVADRQQDTPPMSPRFHLISEHSAQQLGPTSYNPIAEPPHPISQTASDNGGSPKGRRSKTSFTQARTTLPHNRASIPPQKHHIAAENPPQTPLTDTVPFFWCPRNRSPPGFQQPCCRHLPTDCLQGAGRARQPALLSLPSK